MTAINVWMWNVDRILYKV